MYRRLKSPSHPRPKSPSGYGKSLSKLSIPPSRRGQHILERMSKNHIPYASRPTPLELRFAARVSGRGSRPEFTANEVRELAGREAARQRLVTTTWELKASERYTTFLNGLQRENRNSLISSDEELKRIRNVFSDRSQQDLDDDINYLQAVYDDDCEILRAVAAQADVLKRHLGSRVKDDVLLGTMGESSHTPRFIGKAPGTDDSMYDDGDSGDDDDQDICMIVFQDGVSLFVVSGEMNQAAHDFFNRKGKTTTIPKPARGSGLNPSGLPIADQLYLPAEQPQMSAFDFDPYRQSALGWPGYGDEQGPSFYGDAQGATSFGGAQGASSFRGAQGASSFRGAQGVSSFGDSQGVTLFGDSQGVTLFGDSQGVTLFGDLQGVSSFGDTQEQGPSLYDNAQGPSSFSDMQEQPGPFYDDSQGTSSYNERPNYYDDFRDASPSPGPSDHQQGLAPVSRWVEGAPDRGISIVDRGEGLNPPASDLTMIRQGEIPASEVVHHASSSSLNIIKLTSKVVNQTIQGARVLVTRVVFSKNAMMCSRKQKKRIIDKVIEESVPQFYGPNAVFQSFITNAHRKQVGNTLSAKRGKIIDFARGGICNAFRLFPPRGHALPPDQYRIARVSVLIQGTDPLLFMHDFYFDENDIIIVRARFQNLFVMANVIHFVWYWGNASFLNRSSLKAIKNVSCVAGAATYCALYEQGRAQLDIEPFGGRAHNTKFKEIVHAVDGLTGAEKNDFEQYLQHMLDIGPSQTRGNDNSSASDSDSEST
ncbi:hypothetical protein EDB19DRAFT_1827799 [Suillus lakei]|nr:hypothetical protein EDB19DRAFT_1827799 [Suillus lakei]